MGKMSVKENKSIYQLRREELQLSREAASEATLISADRIEKIENNKTMIYPDDVKAMADGYNAPILCNYYCSHECAIGKEYVPEIKVKDLQQITLETLSLLNSMSSKKDRLVDISIDGKINDSEIDDFVDIQNTLEKISILADSLQFWVNGVIESGDIDVKKYEAAVKAANNQ